MLRVALTGTFRALPSNANTFKPALQHAHITNPVFSAFPTFPRALHASIARWTTTEPPPTAAGVPQEPVVEPVTEDSPAVEVKEEAKPPAKPKVQGTSQVGKSAGNHKQGAGKRAAKNAEKTCVLIRNVPRYALRSDVRRLFQDLGVQTDDVRVGFGDKFQRQSWYVKFNDKANLEKALRRAGSHVGTRPVRVHACSLEEWRKATYPRPATWFDKSVLVTGLPEDATRDDVNRFFRGFRLGPRPYDLFYTEVYPESPKPSHPVLKKRRAVWTLSPLVDVERHCLVLFISTEEAWRASVSMQGKFLLNQAVNCKFM